jgi:hypothetical protein
MIQFSQNTNLFFDSIKMVLEFIFVQNLDSNLQIYIMFIVR